MRKLRLLVLLLIIVFIVGCGSKGGSGGGSTEYTLTITCEGYGKVTDESGYLITTRKVRAGTVVTLVPQAEIGSWVFDHWEGEHHTEVVANKITMNGNKNIIAVFSRLTYSISISVIGEGSVTKELVMGAMSFHNGDIIRLVPIPASGYDLDHWEGDLSSYELSPELIVDSDKNITAVFTPMISYADFNETADGSISFMRPAGTWGKTTTYYHSPSYAWTDSPGGNYSDNANLALTSRSINMAGSQNLHLLFWHRYDVEYSCDKCWVEISTDGGNNWAQLKTYTGTDTTWKQEMISLNDYKAYNSIIIRFRLTSDYSVTRDGWYIDDIRIGELVIVSNYYDDVESDLLLMEPAGQWAKTIEASHSGSHCWTDSPEGYYTNNSDTSLTSTTMDLSGTNNPYLSFWHRRHIASYDYCRVEISIDNGNTWTLLKSYTNEDQTWKQEMISLSNYKTNVRIKFRLISDSYATGDGWYIDDIMICDI